MILKKSFGNKSYHRTVFQKYIFREGCHEMDILRDLFVFLNNYRYNNLLFLKNYIFYLRFLYYNCLLIELF